MAPISLPKALYFKRNEKLTLWRDLVNLEANPSELFPKRPGEVGEVYDYRLTSFNPNFPLRYCLELSESALNNQTLFSHDEQVQRYLPDFTGEFLDKLTHKLLSYGDVYLLAVWAMDDTGASKPHPMVIPSYAVRACSEDGRVLLWASCDIDILNTETYETESYAYLWLYQDGELSKYKAPLKVTPNRGSSRLRRSGYQGLNIETIEGDTLNLVEGYPISGVPQPIHCNVYKPNPSAVTSYLRVKLSWLDTINATGYIQRYLKPSQDNSLDLPVDLDNVDTGNNYLLEADDFGFAEMSGATVKALITSLTLLASEQLQTFGLDLANSVTQSGDAIEADSGRFKQVVDSIGTKIRECVSKVLTAYYPNLTEPQLQGLDDYQVADLSGVVTLAKSILEMMRLSVVTTVEAEIAVIQGVVRALFGDFAPEELERITQSIRQVDEPDEPEPASANSPSVTGGNGQGELIVVEVA